MKKIIDINKINLARNLYKNGLSTLKVAQRLEVCAGTINNWCKDIIRTRSEAQKIINTKPPSQKGAIPWNKGKTNIYSEETIVKIKAGRAKQVIKHSEETRRKIGLAHSKEKCTWWNGGISKINKTERKILTDTFEYRQWCRFVFERDNYICQICGEGGRLHANHIKKFSDFPELILISNNGITLCERCEIKFVNHHEEEWESYFNFNLMTRGIVEDSEMVYLADL